jgi:hypothetical protein
LQAENENNSSLAGSPQLEAARAALAANPPDEEYDGGAGAASSERI